jgi:hypothetical protein
LVLKQLDLLKLFLDICPDNIFQDEEWSHTSTTFSFTFGINPSFKFVIPDLSPLREVTAQVGLCEKQTRGAEVMFRLVIAFIGEKSDGYGMARFKSNGVMKRGF